MLNTKKYVLYNFFLVLFFLALSSLSLAKSETSEAEQIIDNCSNKFQYLRDSGITSKMRNANHLNIECLMSSIKSLAHEVFDEENAEIKNSTIKNIETAYKNVIEANGEIELSNKHCPCGSLWLVTHPAPAITLLESFVKNLVFIKSFYSSEDI